MDRIEVTALCTRDEYLRFCAGQKNPALRAFLGTAGGLLAVFGALLGLFGLTDLTTATLLLLCGAAVAAWEPLLLPVYRKGEAGRLYDESKNLSGAIRLVFEGDTLTLQGAQVCGCVPLAACTQTICTEEMLFLRFGAELCLYVPLRAFTEEQRQTVTAALLAADPKE